MTIVVFLAFVPALFTQDSGGAAIVPLELLRPQHGETLHFPTDYVIGELGRGGAPEEAYQIARRVVVNLVEGGEIPGRIIFPEQKRLALRETVRVLGPRVWRIGGGRVEPDGGFSFLIRFLGRERSVTGELYLRREEPKLPRPPPAGDEDEAVPAETGSVPASAAETALASPGETETAAGEVKPAVPGESPVVGEGFFTAPQTLPTEPSGAAGNAAAAPGTAGPPPPAAAVPGTAPPDAAAGPVEAAAVIVSGEEEETPPQWRVDDILLEPSRGLAGGKFSPGGADMTPYERFF